MVVRRAPDAAPFDSAAEAAVLAMLTVWPDDLARVDLGPLLWAPEHQAIWCAMTRVRMRSSDLDLAEWWIAVQRQLHTDLCCGESISGHYVADDGGWQWRCAGWRAWNVLHGAELPSRYDFGLWLDRLERCAEARRIASAAHEIFTRAWRVPAEPFDGAHAIAMLERAAPPRKLVALSSSVNVDDLEV